MTDTDKLTPQEQEQYLATLVKYTVAIVEAGYLYPSLWDTAFYDIFGQEPPCQKK